MHNEVGARSEKRIKRALRVRRHVRGCAEKPRLSVNKSNQHISVQLIDDDRGMTLCSFGTMSTQSNAKRKSKEAAREVGKKIAEFAQGKQIAKVVFDRGRYKFHGMIAELANAAREAGLQF